jgi:hypothetical protein
VRKDGMARPQSQLSPQPSLQFSLKQRKSRQPGDLFLIMNQKIDEGADLG